MKQYTIKNSDIMHNGKIFPEGSTIELEDKEAESLSSYIEEIKADVTLSASSRAETRDEGSSQLDNKEQSTKNKKKDKK